jgi:hypothetical protein
MSVVRGSRVADLLREWCGVTCCESGAAEGKYMARMFITGSAGGLGRAAAQTLLDDGHDVHARGGERLAAVQDLIAAGRQRSSGIWPTWIRCGRWPSGSIGWAGLTR